MADNTASKPEEIKTIEVDTEEVARKIQEELTPKIREELKESISKEVSDEVREDVTKQVRDDFVKKIAGEKEPETYAPKTWQQVKEDMERTAEEKTKSILEEREKQSSEADKTAKQQEADKVKARNEAWDKQVKSLVNEGLISDVSKEIAEKMAKNIPLTTEDRKDPGVKARVKLFETMKQNNIEDAELAFYKHMNRQPAGANAPVGGGSKGVSSSDKSDFTYEEIHNTSIDKLLNENK